MGQDPANRGLVAPEPCWACYCYHSVLGTQASLAMSTIFTVTGRVAFPYGTSAASCRQGPVLYWTQFHFAGMWWSGVCSTEKRLPRPAPARGSSSLGQSGRVSATRAPLPVTNGLSDLALGAEEVAVMATGNTSALLLTFYFTLVVSGHFAI